MTLKSRSDCPLSSALEILGDKWTFLIVRDMAVADKKNFKQFMLSPEGISTSVLSDRLQLLHRHKIISKRRDRKNKLIINYQLTQKGQELVPILISFMDWSLKHVAANERCGDAEMYIAQLRAMSGKSEALV